MLPTLKQASLDLKSKKISSEELTQEIYNRIETYDDKLGAYLSIQKDITLQKAKEIDAKTYTERPMLAGIPLGIKDIISIQDRPNTCASKMCEDYIAPYNASIIEKLQSQDTLFLGKLNMDEFAMGSSGENSAYKITKNPWDINRVPGGSSSGSAAAVAGGLAIATLGTDTGGSIRQPASLCGTVGIKPTYGRVSRYGVVAMASSLDQPGIFAQTVEDAALLLEGISGPDNYDSNAVEKEVPNWANNLPKDMNLNGVRIGIPDIYEKYKEDNDVWKAIDQAYKHLESLGATLKTVTIPHLKHALSMYYIIMPAEVSSNLARFDGIRYGGIHKTIQEVGTLQNWYTENRTELFGDEVKRRILLGTYVLSAGYADHFYKQAEQSRIALKKDYEAVWNEVDLLVGPTSPETAWKIGQKEDPLAMYLSDIYTVATNLAGLPGMSIPCGFDQNDLPIGLHLQGPKFDEEILFRVGHVFEKTTEHHIKKPDMKSFE
jgi:aspartyl-tRNA(Asn)/glutamyl-tRNA(Gln) amidotransferase subunit A